MRPDSLSLHISLNSVSVLQKSNAVYSTGVDDQKLALITVGTLLNSISRSEFDDGLAPRVTPIGYEIGQRCRLERVYDCLRQRQVDVAHELRSRNQNRNAGRRAGELARRLDDADDWAKNYRSYHLGERLVALAVRFACFDGQPIFELQTVREGYAERTKTTQRIALTTAAGDWIASRESTVPSLLTPVYLPMIVPPRPWTSLSEGGYLVTPLNLLKRQPNRRARQLLKKADLSKVFSAVNALQSTAYRINKDIYRTMRNAWDAGNLLFGLKTHTLDQLPPRLPDDADPEQIKERNQERAGTFNVNNQIKGLQKLMALRLSQAERLLDEPQIYFPHQLDHRGRAYPVPPLMNPQSDDIGRALLEFAEGKPLGERGAHWLAIQLANCYWKRNKISFEKRLAWVRENEQEIIAFAEDPFSVRRFWDEADKLWMFLAACKEWKRYREEGPEFRSRLPVSMDGTCNGYQHLSAIGRDPIGGHTTNLVPANEPQDLYDKVADHASRRIQRDAESGGGEARARQGEASRNEARARREAQARQRAASRNGEASRREARARQGEASTDDADAARQLLGKIDRSGVKHATMTTPYGVTRGTIYKQLLKTNGVKSCKDPKKCASYLARVFEECIPEVAVEAGNMMKWLRNVARALAKANRGMAWTTPAGFPVVHETREPKTQRLATADRTFIVYEEDETRNIDARKQADGIVAHLVHSLDAAHMMLTVNRLHSEGVRHFAMVHDSFGVHASDIDLLNRALREEFVRIYSEPVMLRFFKEQ